MFGRKKMYKKGLADAMHAYEDFGKKQEAAIEYMREEVRSGNKKLEDALTSLGDDLNGIYKYLNSKEKAALYHLSTPMDLKELDAEDKRLLLAVLYQLAEDEGEKLTDDQRTYIRSVQKYMEVTNPQTFTDFSAIENIDSIDVQKTFLRVSLEFLYLQDGDELSDKQEEFFDYFSINKKQATVIENEVSRLFNAVGPQGVAEKYGYVPEDDLNMTASVSEINSRQSEECTSETPFDITKEFVDTIFNCSSFSAMDGIQGGAIETQDYIYSQAILFNKKTGEMVILSGKNLPETTGRDCDTYGVVDNKVYYFVNRQYGYGDIWTFDFSDCKAPQKLFAIAPGGISIWAQYLAFSDRDSGIFIYNIERKQIKKISDARGNGAIFATSKGVYYKKECSVYLYDYDSNVSSELFKLPQNTYLSEIYHVTSDSIMYISQYPNHADMAKIDITKADRNGMACVERLLDDVMTDGGIQRINTYQDRIIYVSDGGLIKAVDYNTGEISILASGAESNKWYGHSAERFYRIGNWIYYYMDGDDSKLSRASLTCPGEVELIRKLEYDEIKNMKAQIPEICFS